MEFYFQLISTDRHSLARTGVFHTPHGTIHTPAFIPVGTNASVRAMPPHELKALGVEAVLANTYHLMLRPGADVIAKLGGLHEFMKWPGPIITDSGGFQAFSLGAGIEHGVGKIANIFPAEDSRTDRGSSLRARPNFAPQNLGGRGNPVRGAFLEIASSPAKVGLLAMTNGQKSLVRITERGVEFRSHIDGSKRLLTPEKSIAIQEKLGADIILAFDECTSLLATRAYTERAMERTHRWAARSLETKKRKDQALFGIVQGGIYQNLRRKSAKFISSLPFTGFAIGGSLGTKRSMPQILDWTIPFLPENKPRHLLGIGGFDDIVEAVARGIDWFDCVTPTRLARRGGTALTRHGSFGLTLSKFKKDPKPIEPDCACPTCRAGFSRAYLRHLVIAKEPLAMRLLTAHNLFIMMRFMRELREAIAENKFAAFRNAVLKRNLYRG